MPYRRTCQVVAVLLVFLAGLQVRTTAQNPITAARDALRKAQEEARKKQEAGRQQPAQPAPAAQPAAPGQSAGLPSAAAGAPQASAETTTKIAATLGYLDVAGIKFGMPLSNAMALLKTINPRFQYMPQVEIIWPLDRSNTAAQPPADAPMSTISVAAESIAGGGNVEVFRLAFASHPNAPIVVGIQRKLGWAPGTGPNFESLVDDLRKKYGPESLITSQTTNNVQRNITLRWYYEPNGAKLQGNLAQQPGGNCNVVSNGPAPGICGTLLVFDAEVLASGNGVVSELRVEAESHPLMTTATGATNAYLKGVEQNRANQQRIESTERPRPKL
jgi:hypothetical protein